MKARRANQIFSTHVSMGGNESGKTRSDLGNQ